MNISEMGSRDQNSTRTTETVTKGIQLPPTQGSGSKLTELALYRVKYLGNISPPKIPPYKQTGLSILSNQAVILIFRSKAPPALLESLRRSPIQHWDYQFTMQYQQKGKL